MMTRIGIVKLGARSREWPLHHHLSIPCNTLVTDLTDDRDHHGWTLGWNIMKWTNSFHRHLNLFLIGSGANKWMSAAERANETSRAELVIEWMVRANELAYEQTSQRESQPSERMAPSTDDLITVSSDPPWIVLTPNQPFGLSGQKSYEPKMNWVKIGVESGLLLKSTAADL